MFFYGKSRKTLDHQSAFMERRDNCGIAFSIARDHRVADLEKNHQRASADVCVAAGMHDRRGSRGDVRSARRRKGLAKARDRSGTFAVAAFVGNGLLFSRGTRSLSAGFHAVSVFAGDDLRIDRLEESAEA